MKRVYLKEIETTAGYLQKAPIRFSPKLNCIIGARGTCKSTLIETIRYCLSREELHTDILLGRKAADSHHPAFRLIPETLGAGTARLLVRERDQQDVTTFSIERDPDSQPRVYRDTVREHTDLEILDEFEIYSQGDLQRIADGQIDRLGLIDRPNMAQISSLRTQRGESLSKLRILGREIKSIRNEMLQAETGIRGAPELEEQLSELREHRPKLSAELEASREAFLRREAVSNLLKDIGVLRDQAVDYLEGLEPLIQQLSELANRLDHLGSEESGDVLGQVRSTTSRLQAAKAIGYQVRNDGLMQSIVALKACYEAGNESYYALQRQQSEVNDSIKREDILLQQINHMNRLKERLEELTQRQSDLLHERETHRSKSARITEEIFNLRLEQVEQINDAHGHLVLLSLEEGTQTEDFVNRLSGLLIGSRIRDQSDVAEALAKRITPSTLIDLVESSDVKQLATILDRDIGQMTRLVSQLGDHDDLYDLEADIPEDWLAITLFDGDVAKSIETLSKGQKATALLPLILRSSPHPLVIDQPEDDLDNSFIFQSLVQTIYDLKEHRQVIFVTHNANIPVLGEAEQVVVMQMASPTAATAPRVGSVDERKQEILDLLEGGAKAFEERHKRYAGLL